MSKFHIKFGILLSSLVALLVNTASFAGGISFFVEFPQPIIQTYTPVVMQPVYLPQEQEQCYIQPPVSVHGTIYPSQRICEHRFISTRSGWIAEDDNDYYHYPHHHISHRNYYQGWM